MKRNDHHLMKVESAAGLEGAGEELAVEAVFVSSTSIISHITHYLSLSLPYIYVYLYIYTIILSRTLSLFRPTPVHCIHQRGMYIYDSYVYGHYTPAHSRDLEGGSIGGRGRWRRQQQQRVSRSASELPSDRPRTRAHGRRLKERKRERSSENQPPR